MNSSDNLRSYPPDNHHSSDDVYWSGGVQPATQLQILNLRIPKPFPIFRLFPFFSLKFQSYADNIRCLIISDHYTRAGQKQVQKRSSFQQHVSTQSYCNSNTATSQQDQHTVTLLIQL